MKVVIGIQEMMGEEPYREAFAIMKRVDKELRKILKHSLDDDIDGLETKIRSKNVKD